MDLLNGELHLWEYDVYPHKKHEFRLKISETDKIQQTSHKPNEFGKLLHFSVNSQNTTSKKEK